MTLSYRMEEALLRLRRGPVSPWLYGFGWHTYKALLRRGLVEKASGENGEETTTLTIAGRIEADSIFNQLMRTK
jgi:hypothetical protein